MRADASDRGGAGNREAVLPPLTELVARLGAELGLDGARAGSSTFERTGLVARAEKAFALEHSLEREEEILELLGRYPAASELVRHLFEGDFLHGDALALALFARDALDNVLFAPDERWLVERLAERAKSARRDAFLADNHFLLVSDEAFADRVELELRAASKRPLPDEGVARIRLSVLVRGELEFGEADELIASACETADLDAAWLLDRLDGWSEQELERIDCLVAVYNRALALQLSGFPSVSAYLLRRGAQQLADGEAWRRLAELTLDQGWTHAAESLLVRFAASAPHVEWTALMARLHLVRGEVDRATRLLGSLLTQLPDELDDLAVEFPLFVLASTECALACGQSSVALDAFPSLLDSDPRRLGVSRAGCLLEVAQHDLPSEGALAPLWDGLERAPLHEMRWSDLDLLVEGAQISLTALHQPLARIINAHPQAVTVWRNVIAFLDDDDAQRWRRGLDAALARHSATGGRTDGPERTDP